VPDLDGWSVCVFCGSREGSAPAYARAAAELGTAIAGRGLGLVYGGGNVGLMGHLADAALAAGGRVVGVIPRRLEALELAHRRLHELIVVEDMHQRKEAMARRAQAFIAMPGGYGTLEELFETVAWAQLGFHGKPVGILNTAGYFDPLITFLDHAVQEQFLRPRHRSLLRVGSEAAALLESLLVDLTAA
jgi:uncharacterized protein (TIGR00730 family)